MVRFFFALIRKSTKKHEGAGFWKDFFMFFIL